MAQLTRRAFLPLLAFSLSTLGLSCSSDADTADTTTLAPAPADESSATTQAPAVDLPDVVVTYSVLGAFVERLVGDKAEVTVLIPDGQDPHDFEPSPRDIERINDADFVVANGLDLEEGLDDTLQTAMTEGVDVFFVTDHVTVLDVVDVNDHSAHGHAHPGSQTGHSHGDDDHDHSKDPHVWLSPATMLEALPALVDAAETALSVDLGTESQAFATELAAVDAELQDIFSSLADCQLVTGHNELGHFAKRYGCTVIAATLSSPSTTAEESAGNVEFVIDVIKTHGADAVFTSLGTNPAVARQVADAAGVKLVEISTHYMGDETSYVEFVRTLGDTIAAGLR